MYLINHNQDVHICSHYVLKRIEVIAKTYNSFNEYEISINILINMRLFI